MGFWVDPDGNGVFIPDCDPLPWDPTRNGAGDPYDPNDPNCVDSLISMTLRGS